MLKVFRKITTHYSLLTTHSAGQSLVEILIGLSIGSLLIGASSIAIIGILKSSVSTQNQQASSAFNQETLDRTRSFSNSNWNDLNTLTKGSGTNYFLNASGSTFSVITGKDGIIDNDVLSGLVARWGFDEATSTTATSTYDASGNNNTGNMTGGVTRATSTCKVSTCLSFDGTDDYVNISGSNFNLTSAYTWCSWVKSTVTPSASPGRYIIQNGATSDSWGFSWSHADVNYRQAAYHQNSASAYFAAKLATSLQADTWYFVCGQWDGSSLKAYLNGVLETTTNSVSSVKTQSGNLNIGATGAGSNLFYGLIDEVRVYNRALSANEIQRIYESNRYARYFAIENVCRTNDASSTINSTAPCTGSDVNDPLTQQITAYTQWTTLAGDTYNSSVVDYITRTKNSVFHQTDWSGGTGQTGSLTTANNRFASSSNVATSTVGSFRIKGL